MTQVKPTQRPTELAITLAASYHRYARSGGWLCASQIAANLALLGFDYDAKRLGSTLRRMAETDAPWIERRRDAWAVEYVYRVTRYGRNDVQNKLPAVRLYLGDPA